MVASVPIASVCLFTPLSSPILQGVGGLYANSFVPFLIESFPYDMTELGTYSQLHDARKAALKRDDATAQFIASVPDQVSAWR